VKTVESMPDASKTVPEALSAVSHEATCLVAFKGAFTADDVTNPWEPLPGPYRGAIVVVRYSNVRVVMTVLLPRLPRGLNFSDLH
jgi:hypothetical protein